jgi:hypothetical protein
VRGVKTPYTFVWLSRTWMLYSGIIKNTNMKNFREEQINSTTDYCINQYWEKDVKVDDVNITFYYWRRKEGCKGFTGEERIMKVVGVKDGKKRMVRSVWTINLGEGHCIKDIISKFK